MVWIAIRETIYFLFRPAKSRVRINGFASWLRVAYWLVLLFVLYVSIPHAVRVLNDYEHNEANAISMALAIELVPSLAFLAAMHLEALSQNWRVAFILLGSPFLVLAMAIQQAAFGGVKNYPLDTFWLAATLPYGVLVTSVGIAVVSTHIVKHKDELEQRIANAVAEAQKVEEAKWRELVNQKERQVQALAETNQGLELRVQSLEDATNIARLLLGQPEGDGLLPVELLVSPDSYRLVPVAEINELEASRVALETHQKQLEAAKVELETTREKLAAYQSRPVARPGQIILDQSERDGLTSRIQMLEAQLRDRPKLDPFPTGDVADIFRRLNPRATDRIDQATAKQLLESLWPKQ